MIIIDGVTIEGTDQALTFADEVIKDILADSEKYQDVIKDLSTDAIRDTMRKLEVFSDEFRAGADILGERAYGYLYQASDEALDHAYEELFPIITTLAPPLTGVTDEIDTLIFDTNIRMNDILLQTNARIDELMAGIEVSNEGFWSGIQGWFGERFSDLDNLFAPLTDLISDGVAWLFALPAELLFKFFKNFFFEETEE